MSERIIEGVVDDPEKYRVHIKEIRLVNGEKRFDAVLYQIGEAIPGFLRIEAKDQLSGIEAVELIPYSAISSILIEKDQMSKTILKCYLR